MGTDVISNLAGSLDAELEAARETLRNVDDDIKKVFGKEASELTVFGRNRRGPGGEGGIKEEPFEHDDRLGGRGGVRRREEFDRDGDEPNEKRRRGIGDNFTNSGRLGPPMGRGGGRFGRRESNEDEFQVAGRRLASRIVNSTKEKSREEVLAEQRQDRSGRDRNRRMFGALLGTLQRFKQDETKLKDKEDKRAQIEAKLDEAAKQEREIVKSKKQELIKERRLQLTEIKRLEVKRRRIQELEQWEDKTKYLTNFIRTEAKPHIFYLPKIMNPITDCRLEQSKQFVTEMISSKRKLVLEDLEDYEQRSKRYWEGRMAGRTSNKKIDPRDADIEMELDEIMKKEMEDLPMELEGEDEVENFTVTVFSSQTENGNGNEASIKSEANGIFSRRDSEDQDHDVEKENVMAEPEEDEEELTQETIEVKLEELNSNEIVEEEEEEEEAANVSHIQDPDQDSASEEINQPEEDQEV